MSSTADQGSAGVELQVVSSATSITQIRRFYDSAPLHIIPTRFSVTVKPVAYHRFGSKRPREDAEVEDSAVADATPLAASSTTPISTTTVTVNGTQVQASRGFVQLEKRGVWEARESTLLFYDELHMKQSWGLSRKEEDGRSIVLTTVMAKHTDEVHHGKRWSRPIGRAAIVSAGDVLEIVELATTRGR